MKDSKAIIAAMVKDGCKLMKNVVVKNATASKQTSLNGNDYIRVVLTLNKEVDAYVLNKKTLEYEKGLTRIISVTAPSIGHHLSENEQTAFVRNTVMGDLKLLEMVLSYSKVDLLLEPVKDKQQYTNPFSENPEPHELSHDNIFVHLVGLEMGTLASKRVDKLIDKILDKALESEPIELNRSASNVVASTDNADDTDTNADDDEAAAAS